MVFAKHAGGLVQIISSHVGNMQVQLLDLLDQFVPVTRELKLSASFRALDRALSVCCRVCEDALA